MRFPLHHLKESRFLMVDKNCLSYWYPRLVAYGLPVPTTEIVEWHGEPGALVEITNGKEPDGIAAFEAELMQAALRISKSGPWFLRTGQTSNKHRWRESCFVTDLDKISKHIGSLVEFSHIADFFGLDHEVWAVREYLPVDPIDYLPSYEGMPLVVEARAFARHGGIVCAHPYWPRDAILDGYRRDTTTSPEWKNSIADRGAADPETLDGWKPIADHAARAFADEPEGFSIDLLKTRRGWYVTDMALADRSFHWPGCPHSTTPKPHPMFSRDDDGPITGSIPVDWPKIFEEKGDSEKM